MSAPSRWQSLPADDSCCRDPPSATPVPLLYLLQPSWASACCIWSACPAWPLPTYSGRPRASKHLQRLVLHLSLAPSLGVLAQASAAPPMPAELMRRHEVVFKPRSKKRAVHLRCVGAEHVGRLVSVKVSCCTWRQGPAVVNPLVLHEAGILCLWRPCCPSDTAPVPACTLMLLWLLVSPPQGVCTHVTDVKPQMVVAAYTDAETGFEVYQQVTGAACTAWQPPGS